MSPKTHTGETLGSVELKMTPRVATTAKHMRATRNTLNLAVVPPNTMATSLPTSYPLLNGRHRAGRPTQDVVLVLEQLVPLLERTQLGGVGIGQAGTHPPFDVSPLQSVVQGGFGHPEVLGNLLDRCLVIVRRATEVSSF